uniref:Brain-enriched guanylate kinase-associated protein n=1 Tax=Clastoptera arizonana TaxID=38151 RepID=A0A1B6D3C9_9HEMI
MSQKNIKCDNCGCACRRCSDSGNLHLHVEIENLKQRLLEKEHHIVSMETNFLKEAEKFPNGELAALTDELLTWQNKYSRLYEAHKRVQKVNQNLEDKLLRIVDKCETEKNTLTSEVSSLTRRLVDEKFTVSRLRDENDRYRNDVNIIIQFLQCKPSNFVAQKYDTLPMDLQQKVRNYVKIPSDNNRRLSLSDGNGNIHNKPEMKTIKVPIPTYPPTAMVYSINKTPSDKDINQEEKNNRNVPVDIVSAAIMAKVLEEREKERMQMKHCESCTCPVLSTTQTKCIQTDPNSSCEKCVCFNQSGLNRKDDKFTTGRSSSPMSVRGKVIEKDKHKDNELNKERSKFNDKNSSSRINHNKQLGKIEADLDKLAFSRAKKVEEKVQEAVLINIECNEDNDSGFGVRDEDWPLCGESPTEVDSLISKPSGPRHCSVRVQAGTSNILLDNVVDPYTPILYKSRHTDPLVHSRSRSASSASSSDEAINKRVSHLRTETQI